MATSVVAGSKVALAIEKGEKIPFGWAIDENGQPTDDPYVAQKGAMLPLGGAKGYGLALILDIMAGVLGGGRFGVNQGIEPFAQKEAQFSHFFLAIDIEHFMPLSEFKARMGALIDRLKEGRLAEGSKGIFVPGEIEYNTRLRHQAEGIPYPVAVMDEIDRIAAEPRRGLAVTTAKPPDGKSGGFCLPLQSPPKPGTTSSQRPYRRLCAG